MRRKKHLICFSAGSITIHIPSAESTPGLWTADVCSVYLAEVPCQLYSSSASGLSPSDSAYKASLPTRWQTQVELRASSSAASLPAADAAATLSSQSPSKKASLSSAGQWVSAHQHGMQVQSDLLQGATFTALLELIIGISHVQGCVRRMHQLMHRQQQLIQQMLRHRQHTEQKLAATHQLPVVKAEELSEQRHQVEADGAGASVKLEQQSFERFQPGPVARPPGAFPTKSEDAEIANITGDGRPAASGRRRPPQRLAWHVVSSGVVQIARVGLDHAVLEIRPPPPWSHATSSVQPKSEDGAVNTATADDSPDTDMPDVQQPSTSAHQSAYQPYNKLLETMTQPAPFLTIHMQWKLAVARPPDQHPHLEPGTSLASDAALDQSQGGPAHQEQPPSLGLLSSQGQPASLVLPPPPQGMPVAPRLPPQHGQQHPAGVAVVNEAKGEPQAAHSEGQGIPKLRCCIQSEPELPLQVLESFQDMAGKLTSRIFKWPQAVL